MKKPKKQAATAQETELNRQSRAQWSDYVERFAPAEAQLIRQSTFTAGEKASVKGQVAADAAAAFKGATRSTIAASGGKVNSGKAKIGLAEDALAKGTAKGVGQSMAVTGGEVDAQGKQVGIAAMGRGIAHDATANLARGAQRATSLALAASQARFEKNAAVMDAVSTVAGAATRKYQLHSAKKEHDAFADSLLIDESALPGRRLNADELSGFMDPYRMPINPNSGMG